MELTVTLFLTLLYAGSVMAWPWTANRALTMEDERTANIIYARYGSSCETISFTERQIEAVAHVCYNGSTICYISSLPSCCNANGVEFEEQSRTIVFGSNDRVTVEFEATGGFGSGTPPGVCVLIPDGIPRCNLELVPSGPLCRISCEESVPVCENNAVSCDAAASVCECRPGFQPPTCCDCAEGFIRVNGECIEFCMGNCTLPRTVNGVTSCGRCRPGYLLPSCCTCTNDRRPEGGRCVCRVGTETPSGICFECRSDQELSGEVCVCRPPAQQTPSGRCVTCRSDQELSGEVCVCRPPALQTPSGNCVDCRSDQELSGEVCACSPPAQQTQSGRCVTCRSDQELSGEVCVCRPPALQTSSGRCIICRSDQELSGEVCVCSSPAQQTPSGRCIICRSDQELSGEDCKCPDGEFEENGECKPVPMCSRIQDIVFLLDVSSSFFAEAFVPTIKTIAQLTSVVITSSDTNFGLVVYPNDNEGIRLSSTCPTFVSFLDTVAQNRKRGTPSETHANLGIEKAIKELNRNPSRPGVVVTITTAASTGYASHPSPTSDGYPPNLIKKSIRSAMNNVEFFALGILSTAASTNLPTEISALANSDDNHYRILERNQDSLIGETIVSLLERNGIICEKQANEIRKQINTPETGFSLTLAECIFFTDSLTCLQDRINCGTGTALASNTNQRVVEELDDMISQNSEDGETQATKVEKEIMAAVEDILKKNHLSA